MRKQVMPCAHAFGSVEELLIKINEAKANGATDFFIPIEEEKDGTVHARWIEFYREVPIDELVMQRDELQNRLKLVEQQIKTELSKV